jgi:opacity protein-like surface antigen
MKKSFAFVAVFLLFALTLSATDEPKMETFLGYNFVRFNPDSPFVPSFNANGGSGQFVYNFNHWIGAMVDLGAVNRGTLYGGFVDATVMDFVAGPKVTWHNHSRFTPFVNALFGGAYSTASASITALQVGGPIVNPQAGPIFPNTPIAARIVASHTGFAMLIGGGLDYKVSKHIAFRPLEADYYLTRLPSILDAGNTSNRNNFRYAGGVNFLFGGAK